MALANAFNNTLFPGQLKSGGTFASGDIWWVDENGVVQRLPSGTVGQLLVVTDLGGGVLAPGWSTGAPPGGNAGGDLTGSYPNPTIAPRAVTFSKFQAINSGRFLGRATAGSGDVEALTDSDFRAALGLGSAALLDTGTAQGNVPLLGVGGLLDTAVIPPLRSHEFVQVADETARLALTDAQVQPGDEVFQQDTGATYKLIGADPSVSGNWVLVSDVTLDASAIVSGIFPLTRLPVGTSENEIPVLGAGGKLDPAVVPGGLAVVVVTGTTATMNTNTQYQTDNAAQVALQLPATSEVGDQLEIIGIGAGGWRISQAAGQQIYFGELQTTNGTSGRIDSTHQRDTLILRCIANNTTWQVVSSVGNLDVV